MSATLPRILDDIHVEPIWNLLLEETGNWLTAKEVAQRVDGAVGHAGAVLRRLWEKDLIERDHGCVPNRFRIGPVLAELPLTAPVYATARPGEEATPLERQGNALVRIRGLAEEAIACSDQCHCCESMRTLKKIIADLERA